MNQAFNYINCWLKLFQFEKFIGLMGLIDISWSEQDCIHIQFLQVRRFRGKGYARSLSAGQSFRSGQQV